MCQLPRGWRMVVAMVEYRFDRFVVEPDRRRLLIDGKPTKIGARAFDVLQTLIERRQKVVSKNELLDLIWPGTAVEPGNLQVHIFALRKLLGAGAIATIPGRGYQFTSVIEGQQSAITSAPTNSPPPIRALPGNLASHFAALYGRNGDLAKLAMLIAQHRLVSIVGPGGIGKTRLAQVVARERRGVDADGAWLVELAQIEKSELIVPTIARVLGRGLISTQPNSD
jgi:DNA-binding winged helix-turn-helix (wHTH) protein